MVQTIKFSQFASSGLPAIGDTEVGLKSGANTNFTQQWTWYPPGNTASRPISPVEGILRFNTDLHLYEYFDALTAAWQQLVITPGDSGTVLPGTINQIAYYASSGNTLSGTFTLPSIVQANISQLVGLTGSLQAPTFIGDSSGNEALAFNYISSAVNYFTLQNSASGSNLALFATGSDTNIGVNINAKGNKPILLQSQTGDIALSLQPNSLSNSFMGSFAIPTITANRTYTFQDASGTVAFLSDVAGAVTSVQGTANQVLVNATSGTPETGAVVLTLPQDIGLMSSPTFASITLTNGVLDATSNTIFTFTSVPTSVNYLSSQAQITGVGPLLKALGSDTDINISYETKAAGVHRFLSLSNTPISIFSGTTYQHQTDFVFANTLQARTVTWQDASGTVAFTSDVPTGAALTKTDDTNVTLSLGGSPSTALINAASLTLGWTGTLSGTRGGTGVNNGASTITIGGSISFIGASTFAGTLTGNTAVTFPTSGTLATTTQLPTPAALTKTDDTNVTLTLGGTPATALLQATSLTLGWTGQLAVARGGTGISSFGTGVATALGQNVSGSGGIVLTTSPALVTPTLGAANATSLTFTSTSGVIGTTTNDNAAAGSVGEYISAQQLTPQSLTTNMPLNVISISLTAGDWDVSGTVAFSGNMSTILGYALASTNSTTATLDPNFNYEFSAGGSGLTNCNPASPVPLKRYSISSTTTIYLVAQSGFTISTYGVIGFISARRIR